MLSLSRSARQPHDHLRSLPLLALDREAAAGLLDDLAALVEADSQAALFGRLEGAEETLANELGAYPAPGVAHHQDRRAILGERLDQDGPLVGNRLDGIEH